MHIICHDFLKTLFRLISLLLATTLFTFILISYSPFDPITAYIGADAMISPEQLANIAEHWGLNESPIIQYSKWLMNILQGDMGTSLIFRRPVFDILIERAGASLILMTSAWILSGLLGFILGIIAGVYQYRWPDKIITFIALIFASAPVFWLGLVCLALFSVYLNWFPLGMAAPIGKLSQNISITDRIHHLILPVFVLSITGIANITLHTKVKMQSILDSEYMLFAKARGETTWQATMRHGLRNIALPALTLQLASISELFGGSILAEQVFSYPGLGNAVIQAGLKGDVPLLLAIALFSAVLIFIGNLCANILYKVIDPRIRYTDLYHNNKDNVQ